MKALTLKQVRYARAAMEGDDYQPIASYEAARQYANPGDPYLHNMVLALSCLTRLNTADDWRRLEAALVILAHHRRRQQVKRAAWRHAMRTQRSYIPRR